MHSYSKIYQALLEQIQSGELKEGDLIPKELDLSARYGVSRPTVRQALNLLVIDGYLRRVRGRGSYVTKPKVLQQYTQFIESYNYEMEKKGLVPLTKVLEISLTYPGETVQTQLNIPADRKIVKLQRLRSVSDNGAGKPIILTTVYFPFDLVPDVFTYDFEKQSFYDVLSRHGVQIKRGTRLLEIKALYKEKAALFGLPDGSPCHYISSVGYDEDGRPVEYSENYYPADRNKFIIEIVK